MRRNRVRQSMYVVGLLGLLGTLGCEANLQEAALAGLYDFVSGTVTDTLTQLMSVPNAAWPTAVGIPG